MRQTCQLALLTACWLQFAMTPAQAQQEEELSPRVIRQTLTRQASNYKIQVPASQTRLQLHAKSLLNWNNPQRTTEVGVVQVWTDAGMPLVVASLFTYEYQGTKLKHEFISLTDEKLVATYGAQTAWTPQDAGVNWSALPNAAKSARTVGNSKVRRLIQMRRVAAEFKFDVTARDGQTTKLRLMTQPIFRFESAKYDVVDGAIFAYSVATDPEVLLVVKANSKSTWEYALVRSTNLALVGHIQSKQIWQQEAIPELDNSMIGEAPFSNYPYTSFHPTADRLFEPLTK